jgi:hypothetical protein
MEAAHDRTGTATAGKSKTQVSGGSRYFALRAALALAGACLALWVASYTTWGSASAWPRFEDDAYYYLTLARNVAAGRGFTTDGIAFTNGFQPLWMWLLVPLAWLTSGDSHLLFGAAQLLVVLLFCLGGALLFEVLRTSCGLRPALLGMAVLLAPPCSNVLLSGMESGITLVVFVCLFEELLRSGALEDPSPRLRDARVGVWLGLLLLARLDAVFVSVGLVAHVLGIGLLRGSGSSGDRVRGTIAKGLALFAPTVLLVVPYLVWNLTRFGHLVPISGALKTTHSHLGFNPENLGIRWLGMLVLIVAGTVLALRRPAERRLGRTLAPVTAGLVLQGLHATVFMAWAVFAWHFALFIPTGAIAAALLARRLEERMSRGLVTAGLAALACLWSRPRRCRSRASTGASRARRARRPSGSTAPCPPTRCSP